MDGTPRTGTPLPCSPLEAGHARQIAEAFRPQHAWGSRRDYYYTRAKLGSDPLYDGVLQHLPDDGQPLLDLGCGLGLFAHVLRQRGRTPAYLGLDVDAGKIARARRAAAALADARFHCLDVQAPLPAHAGHVLLLDVLQYLEEAPQLDLLRAVSERVAPGAQLLLRTPLATGDRRDRTTRIADRLAWLVGWMGTRPRHYPDPQALQATLAEAGLQVGALRPLHGRTPFNSWLLVARRER
ncbi:methyltransferase domain-containing protein [Stenotrophomonas tuberculopleuritidis]|uniref:methyltransferase domain-containing protein n=1 Tax=Stenotrophomonas tuberculopleuritidis TaxID=3055079 RepID=UPI0026E56DD1|nr:methyltransferase domain-containing protein [Stenotrophomonas sp. 704A1]